MILSIKSESYTSGNCQPLRAGISSSASEMPSSAPELSPTIMEMLRLVSWSGNGRDNGISIDFGFDSYLGFEQFEPFVSLTVA